MNATAIYSKSGKGVQEASGKTSHLSRSDRAVLAAIDGRATLADVAQKVGKPFDPAFERLIESLDKGGFIREVSAGSAGGAKLGGARPGAKPAAPSPMDASTDLDFTTALSQPKAKAPPPPPPPPSAEEKARAERIAREQQEAVARAREEAERKAAAERERVKAEAEAKMRAETEAKLRAEADAKVKAEAEAKAKAAADAKVKAAQEAAARAAAEAKAKAEAEAKRAREEAERARQEAEEKARREQEELMRKLEEERRAREEAERKAQEERRKLEEERVSRRIQEERERVERRRFQQEEEERAAKRRPKDEDEQPLPELSLPEPAAQPRPEPAPAGGAGFSDSLLADLESFTTRDEEEQRATEEAARKEREAAAARAREAEERRAKEEAERREREQREMRKREEAERKAREEAELREREQRDRLRLEEEEDRRRSEAEERAQKAKQEERVAARAERAPDTFVEEARARSRRERELSAKPRGAQAAGRRRWGKPIALTLFGLLVVAVGVAHVMPIDTADYERAATDALGRPVRIGSARLSFLTGLQLKLSDVRIGDSLRIPEMRAYPELSALLGSRKVFDHIEIDGARLEQAAVGRVLFASIRAGSFSVGRVTARNLELTGPLALPKGLEFEAVYDRDGALRTATVRGPDALLAKFSLRGQGFDAEISGASFTLPFAPEITLAKFSAKGIATPQGMTVSEWDGAILSGIVSGTANVRWGDNWSVDGVVTGRNLYAAVFAPALVSDGKAEGSGKFQMRGAPGKLASNARLDGSFTVTRGVLGSIDLTRAIQTGGKFATGRTEFSEMNGQATYDRGAVSLRNVTLSAGQLNAGASADISQSGALSGRIVADVRVASQTLRATLNLGGTVKEPQVRN
jgi:hypothetical protein